MALYITGGTLFLFRKEGFFIRVLLVSLMKIAGLFWMWMDDEFLVKITDWYPGGLGKISIYGKELFVIGRLWTGNYAGLGYNFFEEVKIDYDLNRI